MDHRRAHVVLASGVFALAASVGSPRLARAQPCGDYQTVALGTTRLQSGIAAISAAVASGDDAHEAPTARVAAYRAALQAIHGLRLSICERPLPSEAAQASTIGLDLNSPYALESSIIDKCAALVQRAHVAGPNARACVEGQGDWSWFRFAHGPIDVPPPPARWADAEDPSAVYDAMRGELRQRPRDDALRVELARVELASADFRRARATLRGVAGYDAALLGVLVEFVLSASEEYETVLIHALRRLANREPRRIEAHLALVEIAEDNRQVSSRELLHHELACLCLLGSSGSATERSWLSTGIAREWEALGHGRPWAWDGQGPAPELPLPAELFSPSLPASSAGMPVRESCDSVLARHE